MSASKPDERAVERAIQLIGDIWPSLCANRHMVAATELGWTYCARCGTAIWVPASKDNYEGLVVDWT